MSNYKISVIIPTYNTGYYLTQAVDSIIKQSFGFENIEVVFVDDNSDDGYTKNLLKEYGEKYSNCKVINLKDNSGFPGIPRNIGLENASGEYVIFMDHDDSYDLKAFETMYNKIIEDSADFVFTTFTRVYADKEVKANKIEFKEKEVYEISSIDENPNFLHIAPSIWTKLFNKDFLIKNNIRFIENMLGEDLEFYTHSLLAANKVVYFSQYSSYNYNIRDSENNKSTIHLYTKNYLEGMINGYIKTYNLLKEYDKEAYFSILFKGNLKLFMDYLIKSTISDREKIYLIERISPLLKKQYEFDSDFLKNICTSIEEPLLKDDYSKVNEKIKENYKARLEINEDTYYEKFYKNENYNTLNFEMNPSDEEFLTLALVRNKKIYSRCSITDIKSDFNILKIDTTTAKNSINDDEQVFNMRYPTYRIYGDFKKGSFIEITFTINELSPFEYNILADNIYLHRRIKIITNRNEELKENNQELREKNKEIQKENKQIKIENNYYNELLKTKPYRLAGFVWDNAKKFKKHE